MNVEFMSHFSHFFKVIGTIEEKKVKKKLALQKREGWRTWDKENEKYLIKTNKQAFN